MTDLTQFLVSGLVLGAVYAVAASGLVLTYSTSGIFNFAHGTFGMLGAFTYWGLTNEKDGLGWPSWLAILVVLGVVAPLFGAVIERVIMRGLEGVSPITRLVVSVSLLVGILRLGFVLWDPNELRQSPGFFSGRTVTIADYGVTYHSLITIGVAIAIAIGLRLFLYETRLGIAMRSVVDNRNLASLNGARPARAAMASWALGSMLAAAAGILLAGSQTLNHLTLTLLVINAYAAAMFGRLRSLPLTFLGAIVIGLLDSFVLIYLTDWVGPGTSMNITWLGSFRNAVPIITLFVVLLIIPTDQVRHATASSIREIVPRPSWRRILIGCGILVAVALAVGIWLDGLSGVRPGQDLADLNRAVGFAIIMLSLVPLTGYAGQISLAQMAFAGIGGLAMAQWGDDNQWLALFAGMVIAGAVGALVALPALRLRGIYLALSTMAFAAFMERFVFVELPILENGSVSLDRMSLPGISLESNAANLVFLSVVFSILCLFVVWIRRGRFGRQLQAMKDSEAASATIGMSLTFTKLWVFTLSAAMAGLGGALYFTTIRSMGVTNLTMIDSLLIALMAVVGGIASVGGALFGGVALASFDIIARHAPALADLLLIAPGLIGISLGRNPNGAVNATAQGIREWRERDPSDRPDDIDLEGLGVDRPYTPADVGRVDEKLDLAGVRASVLVGQEP